MPADAGIHSWYIPEDIGPCPFPSSMPGDGAPCSSTIAIDAGYTPMTLIAIGVLSALSVPLVLELLPVLRRVRCCAPTHQPVSLRAAQVGFTLLVSLSDIVQLLDFHGNAGFIHPAVSWIAFNFVMAGTMSFFMLLSLQFIALVLRLERIVLQRAIRRDRGAMLLRAARWSCAAVTVSSVTVSFGEGFSSVTVPLRIAWYVIVTLGIVLFPLASVVVSAGVLHRVQRELGSGQRVRESFCETACSVLNCCELGSGLRDHQFHAGLSTAPDAREVARAGDAPPPVDPLPATLPPPPQPLSRGAVASTRSHELAIKGIRHALALSCLAAFIGTFYAGLLWFASPLFVPPSVFVWPGYRGIVTPAVGEGLTRVVIFNIVVVVVLCPVTLYIYGEGVVVKSLFAACLSYPRGDRADDAKVQPEAGGERAGAGFRESGAASGQRPRPPIIVTDIFTLDRDSKTSAAALLPGPGAAVQDSAYESV